MTGIKKITYDFSKFDIQKKLIELEMKNLPKEEAPEPPEEEIKEIKENISEKQKAVKETIETEKTKKDIKLKKLREKQLKTAMKALEKVMAKLKKEQNIKLELRLRESNLDTGVKG